MFLLLSSLALATPAMVTTCKGEVRVQGSDEALEAPFVLEDGQVLEVADGGMVVVLYQGAATQVEGPASVDHGTLAQAGASAGSDSDMLDELLSRGTSAAPTGATRAVGDLTLARPVPGSQLLALQTIRWDCDACGEQPVEVYSFRADEVLWTGTGAGTVAYGGPALAPGPYAVRVGTEEYSFSVAKADTATQVQSAQRSAENAVTDLQGQGVTDAATLLSVPTAVYLQAGMHTEALYLVDQALAETPGDPGLTALQGTLEERAGVAR